MATPAVTTRANQVLRPRGVHFPFMKRKDGLPSGDGPPDIFVSNIKQIIFTMFGERVMRPRFGCDLKKLLFSPIDEYLTGKIRETIASSINVWEPRVSITDISVGIGRNNEIRVRVIISTPVGPSEVAFSVETAQ